ITPLYALCAIQTEPTHLSSLRRPLQRGLPQAVLTTRSVMRRQGIRWVGTQPISMVHRRKRK
ncbi:MAG TPA: hypothetical protein VFG02_03150, partial [Nitrospirota bacterium]|nr:hypothetical protein [Nitrospirota bacterium]